MFAFGTNLSAEDILAQCPSKQILQHTRKRFHLPTKGSQFSGTLRAPIIPQLVVENQRESLLCHPQKGQKESPLCRPGYFPCITNQFALSWVCSQGLWSGSFCQLPRLLGIPEHCGWDCFGFNISCTAVRITTSSLIAKMAIIF